MSAQPDPELSATFEQMIARSAADQGHAATHEWAHGYVQSFDQQVEKLISGMTEEQRRFIWCSVEEMMRWLGVAVDSPTALRLMYLLIIYGHWQKVLP